MKRIICFLALLLMVMGSVSSAETRIMSVTDIHYLARSLYEGSEMFLEILKTGDGKLTQYGDELLDALYREIQEEKPDALLVTGDLSFNGEKQSHLDLAAWFSKVEASGVPVWVIPGNHDINTRPAGFTRNGYYSAETVNDEEFREIYRDFMLPGGAGCSYAAPVSDELWVLMTDVSFCPQTFGVFMKAHSDWLREALGQAEQADVRVMTATHHNLVPHTEFTRDNYLMFGNEGMLQLLTASGVPLNLSGHMHVQNIASQDGVTDAASGAFSVWPHRYALVTLSDEAEFRYEARTIREEFLPEGLMEESREWFSDIVRNMASSGLTAVPEENRALMLDYAARFNLAYFSGTYQKGDPSWKEDPTYRLWNESGDQRFFLYMDFVMDEGEDTDVNHLLWEEKPSADPLPEA